MCPFAAPLVSAGPDQVQCEFRTSPRSDFLRKTGVRFSGRMLVEEAGSREAANVRSDRQDRPGDRGDRRDRRGDRPRALHARGTVVAVSGTRREALDALAADLKERVHALPANLADKEAVEALIAKAEQAMGKLDVLIANAGINATICLSNCATRTGSR